MSIENLIQDLTKAIASLDRSIKNLRVADKIECADFDEEVEAEDVAEEIPSDLPFSTKEGMIKYVFDAAKKVGNENMKKIQDILDDMGHKNIHDVQPGEYAKLHRSVESVIEQISKED